MFEVNVKEFRLLADFLNNVSLLLNLSIALYPTFFLPLSCLSAICSSLCGLIAGATKARISAHFAKGNHLADITAKESTQETAVTLMGLVLGYYVAKLVGENLLLTWIVFVALLVIHQVANYILIRVLILDTVNPQKCWIVFNHQYLSHYLENGAQRTKKESIAVKDKNNARDRHASPALLSPESVCGRESIWLPLWLHWTGPKIGCSLATVLDSFQCLPHSSLIQLPALLRLYAKLPFIVAFDRKCRLVVCLAKECNDEEQLLAFMIALYIQKQLRLSPPELQKNYLYLIKGGFEEAFAWCSSYLDEAAWTNAGWDVGEGKLRLGSDQWRYKMSLTDTHHDTDSSQANKKMN